MKGLLFTPWMMRVKRVVGPMLANDLTGALLARLFANRIPHRGLVIDTSHPGIDPAIKAALFWRGYESGEYRFMSRYLPPDRDVVELGGSIGVISCAIARKLGGTARHIAVEADPALAEVLRKNLALNRCEARTQVEAVAISYSGAPAVSFSRGPNSVSGAIADSEDKDSFSVPAMTLSVLLAKHDIDRYALVCDIEGVEWDIFANDREALSRADVLIIEMHDRGDLTGVARQLAFVEQYELFRLVDHHGPVAVFVADREDSALG